MKKLLHYDRYPIHYLIFGSAFSLISVWTLLSFFYAWAADEGTLADHPFDQFMAISFSVWRFPLHNLLFLVVDIIPFLTVLYFPLLLANSILYALLVERLTVPFRLRK